MKTNPSRREFLQNTTRCAAGALLSGAVLARGSDAPEAGWVTAIRDAHLRATGEKTCWAALERLGVSGMEVVVNDDLICPALYDPGRVHRVTSTADRQALQEELSRRGLRITALCLANRLEERLETEVAWIRRVAEAAEQLNVRAIRIDVAPEHMSPDSFLDYAVGACKRLCDAVKGTSVKLGIENHGRFTNDPRMLQTLLDRVDSDRLGLTLDAMNFYWFGHPLSRVYDLCEQFAPRVFHTHCKNLRYPEDRRNVQRPVGWEYDQYSAPLHRGDLDYGKITAILRRANYHGDLCLENECLQHFPKQEHVPILREELATLRRLASAS